MFTIGGFSLCGVLKVISIKIEKRENGSIGSVLAQGHASEKVGAAVTTLMSACGHQFEIMKAGIIEIDDKEMYMISGIKQTKQSMAVVDTLVDGLENVARQYPFSVQIQYLWADK